MKATGIIRRIDDLGRVAIPKEIRRTVGAHDGDPFMIFFDDNGNITLRKYVQYCNYCGETIEDDYGNSNLCNDCMKILKDHKPKKETQE
jgi:transcriptional pleiotropic regulator of transition state genes